jgi:hypothetical protein
MAGYIEDRWYKKGPGGKRNVPTERHGQGKRYKVTGIPGVRSRSFVNLTGPQGAKAWLAKAQHESSKGEVVDPRSGAILLADYFEEYWATREGDPGTLEGQQQSIRASTGSTSCGTRSLR